MAFGLHLGKDVLNLAVVADDESGPGNAHDFLSVHILLLPDSKGLGGFLVGIGEQGEGKAVLVLEFLLCLRRVGRNSEDDRAGFLNLLVGIAEPASFYGSAGSVGTRKEIEDDGLAPQIFKGEFFAVLILQSEVRGFIMNIHGSLFSKS